MIAKKDFSFLPNVDAFISQLKIGTKSGSLNVAHETAKLLREIISSTKWSNAETLIKIVKEVGYRLSEAQPVEMAVGNIVRRVLYIIREEYLDDHESDDYADETLALSRDSSDSNVFKSGRNSPMRNSGDWRNSGSFNLNSESSMYNLLAECLEEEVDYSKQKNSLKQSIMQQINDLIDDLKNVIDQIACQALQHIHSNEIIMTIGKSKTVEAFLKAAAKKRKFHVIVCETAPFFAGQELAMALAKEGIETTVIADSAIFAMMARVNKVIIGTHAVCANGGLIAISGSHLLSIAAKYHSTPVVVCTGLFKMSPLFPHDTHSLSNHVSPFNLLPFKESDFIKLNIDSINPYYDYVSPHLVNMFITNMGGHSPTYIYRLLGEMYHSKDFDLTQ